MWRQLNLNLSGSDADGGNDGVAERTRAYPKSKILSADKYKTFEGFTHFGDGSETLFILSFKKLLTSPAFLQMNFIIFISNFFKQWKYGEDKNLSEINSFVLL